jgi:hypothetical protein
MANPGAFSAHPAAAAIVKRPQILCTAHHPRLHQPSENPDNRGNLERRADAERF